MQVRALHGSRVRAALARARAIAYALHVNRKQRRLQAQASPGVSSRPTTGLRFKCGGLHDAGCPDRATIVLAIGTRAARDGLALDTLHAALKGAGWALGAGKTPGPNGDVSWLDPLCRTCARALAGIVPTPTAPDVRYSLDSPASEEG